MRGKPEQKPAKKSSHEGSIQTYVTKRGSGFPWNREERRMAVWNSRCVGEFIPLSRKILGMTVYYF